MGSRSIFVSPRRESSGANHSPPGHVGTVASHDRPDGSGAAGAKGRRHVAVGHDAPRWDSSHDLQNVLYEIGGVAVGVQSFLVWNDATFVRIGATNLSSRSSVDAKGIVDLRPVAKYPKEVCGATDELLSSPEGEQMSTRTRQTMGSTRSA